MGINITEVPGAEEAIGHHRRMALSYRPSGSALADYLAGVRRARTGAVEAQERMARMTAACPLTTSGDRLGCADQSECDRRGSCAANDMITAQHIRDSYRPCSVCGAADHAGVAHPSVVFEDEPEPMSGNVHEIMDEIVRRGFVAGPEWITHSEPMTDYPFETEMIRDMIQSSERPRDEIVSGLGYGHTNSTPESADGSVESREGACPRCADCGHTAHINVCRAVVGATHATDQDVEEELCGCLQQPYRLPEPDGEPVRIDAQTSEEILNDWAWEGGAHRVVLEGDPDYNDLQTYLEGGTLESTEAAKRLDQRAVDAGQLSPKTFWDTWNELPRSTEQAHKIWCARWRQHHYSECPVWGAE
jgi:hypothetical protein